MRVYILLLYHRELKNTSGKKPSTLGVRADMWNFIKLVLFSLVFFVEAVGPGFVYLLVVGAIGAGAVAMYMSRHQDRNKTPAESW
jgi:hypothetical protein